MSQKPDLGRRVVAEGIGTAMLLATIVGSGIMAQSRTSDAAVALLANTIATGAALIALILTFGSISGAHFNPVVTVADAALGGLSWRDVPAYVAAQIVGAFAGVGIANFMFEQKAIFFASTHVRTGASQWTSEFVATFGLLAIIWGSSRRRPSAVPYAVGGYITAAYWFTSSTSFANPAVTLARSASDTFAGIRPADVPGFVIAQCAGALIATLLFRWLTPVEDRAEIAKRVLDRSTPHAHDATKENA